MNASTTDGTILVVDDCRQLRDLMEIILVRNGARFRVTPDSEDPWANYDPEKVRAALRKFAGMLTPEEGERIKENIYRGREEGARPLDRP